GLLPSLYVTQHSAQHGVGVGGVEEWWWVGGYRCLRRGERKGWGAVTSGQSWCVCCVCVLQSKRLVSQLRGRVSELEAELAEQAHLKEQARDQGDFLRAELEEVKRKHEDTEKAQRSLSEIERKAQANEQRYTKLKEKYTELVQNHAELLRKVGPFNTVCGVRVCGVCM
uniref:Uncharacterized protein n=1 Tax=Callorhinchus milii TaxID=7868 RepID=A0A4W3GU10_CALMI